MGLLYGEISTTDGSGIVPDGSPSTWNAIGGENLGVGIGDAAESRR